MLRDEYVTLKVENIKRHQKYFTDKGYELPTKIDKRGYERLDLDKEICIRIKDLQPNSNVKVVRICDKCGEEKEVFYFSVLRQRKHSDIDLCKTCSIRQREIAKEGESIFDFSNRLGQEFVKCNVSGYENYTSYDFKKTSNIKVLWKCSNCDYEWECKISDRTLGKSICPNCSNRILNDNTSLFINYPNLMNEWDYEKNIISPKSLTSGSHEYVWWKCSKGHSWSTLVHSRTCMKSDCPICAESKGEQRIRHWLETHNINFEAQKEFDGLIGTGGGLLSYDFYLPNHNLLIEYQGQFHDGNGNDYIKQYLETQKEHDKRKREYSEKNNINLLEIWYWDFDNIEKILEKELKGGDVIV